MNKELFIKQFSRIAWQSKKQRSQEEIDASMDELWADDPFATMKLIMVSAARSRKQCPLRLGKGVAKVDVMGFYSMKEGLGHALLACSQASGSVLPEPRADGRHLRRLEDACSFVGIRFEKGKTERGELSGKAVQDIRNDVQSLFRQPVFN